MLQRNQLRQDLRHKRNMLSCEQQRAAANALASVIYAIPQFQHATTIGTYIARDGEIDPAQLIVQAWHNKQDVYLPKIQANRELAFVHYEQASVLKKNQYGIPEPDTANIATTLDVILVPLVGFDRSGNRLGMGGGYYDRYLSRQQQSSYSIGLAHQCQQVAQLDVESWDIPLNAIITDTEVILS